MTRAFDCLDQMLKHLNEIEDKIEHENMLHPDERLDFAEIALHRCIEDVQRAKLGKGHDYDGQICRTDSYGARR